MKCADYEEDPPATSFTECAMIALYYSSEKEKPQGAVDYTRARYVKKPSGARPGAVIYTNQKTVFVTPERE